MPDNQWIQYGSFGLIAALVIWSLWKGIPGVLQTHKDTVTQLATAFETRSASIEATFKSVTGAMLASAQQEAKACREEREKREAQVAAEREADRLARHNQANATQKLMLRFEDMIEREHGQNIREQAQNNRDNPPASGRIPRPPISRGIESGPPTDDNN